MVKRDLEAAELLYVNTSGETFDFHALRGQFITDVQRHGASLGDAQKLARHTDPRLTANYYSHPHLVDLAGAVGRLPAPPRIDAPSPQFEPVRATGTDGAPSRILSNSCHPVASASESIREHETQSRVIGFAAPEPASDRNSLSRQSLETPPESIGEDQTANEKEPPGGFEPSTYALRMRRSTN